MTIENTVIKITASQNSTEICYNLPTSCRDIIQQKVLDMKKLIHSLFSLTVLVTLGVHAEPAKTWTRDEFRIRDPFVLPDGDTYYLYETKPWFGGNGVSVRTSKDLDHWTDKEMVLLLPPDVKNTAVWAPEVHKYGSTANCRKRPNTAATHPNTAGRFGAPRCRVGTPPLTSGMRQSEFQAVSL